MATDLGNELADFHAFIGRQLSTGAGVSPEEVLELYRAAHPDPQDFEDTVAAVEEAFAEYQAGNLGLPLAEFDRNFRARNGLPDDL